MKFNEIVNYLMPLVNNASDLPCIIWRKNDKWNMDYINLPKDKIAAYFEEVKIKDDPYAILCKGEDFSHGSFPFVFDKVLTARLHAEYKVSGASPFDDISTVYYLLEDDISGLSNKAANYIASLDKPLTEITEIYLSIKGDMNLEGKVGEALIERIEVYAANAIKEINENSAECVQIIARVIAGNKLKNSVDIIFPVKAEELYTALNTGNLSDCKIVSITCEAIPNLTHYIGYEGNNTDINELQYISTLITNLTTDEVKTFSAFLEVQYTDENITVKHVMNALENLGTIHLDTSLKTVEDVGNEYLNAMLSACSTAYNKLIISKDQQELNLVKFVQTLNEHVDVEAYGRKVCEENDFYQTSKGMISVDWSAFFHRADREVPDEFILPDKTKPSILKQVEDNKTKISKVNPLDKQKKMDNAIE